MQQFGPLRLGCLTRLSCLGDAWLLGTCRHHLGAKPHGWVAFGGIILDQDPIAALDAYSPRRLADEFNGSLQLPRLDHLAWHGLFFFSAQSCVATREDSITITVAVAATTGPYHDLTSHFDEQPLGPLLVFRAAAVEDGRAGIDDACRLAHHQWNVPTANRAALVFPSSWHLRRTMYRAICG